LGCPIVGDEIYGRKKLSVEIGRHFLHAYRLKIILPGENDPRLFEAPLPRELSQVVDSLRHGR
jgi:23S rRNA pseudouridine1911/1915/1917 synthase